MKWYIFGGFCLFGFFGRDAPVAKPKRPTWRQPMNVQRYWVLSFVFVTWLCFWVMLYLWKVSPKPGPAMAGFSHVSSLRPESTITQVVVSDIPNIYRTKEKVPERNSLHRIRLKDFKSTLWCSFPISNTGVSYSYEILGFMEHEHGSDPTKLLNSARSEHCCYFDEQFWA